MDHRINNNWSLNLDLKRINIRIDVPITISESILGATIEVPTLGGDRVKVMIEDNGVGFDPREVLRGEHFGLLGMRERAEALGGTMNLESAPGSGTTVVVEVASADPHPDR